MLEGILPLIYGILIAVILISAARQLWKNFRVGKFIPWLLCAAFIIYAANHNLVFDSLGASVWKVAEALVSKIHIPKG